MFAQGALTTPGATPCSEESPAFSGGPPTSLQGEPAADLQAGGSTLTGGPSSPACLAPTLAGIVHHFQPLSGAEDPKNCVSQGNGLPGLGAPSPDRRGVI